MMQLIDPHIHLFNLTQGQYSWLKPGNPPQWPDKSRLHRTVSEQDIMMASLVDNKIELAGYVHIEAGFDNEQPWREIAWLESHCKQPMRSIACIDISLSNEAFSEQLTQLVAYDSVVGIRHILDDDALLLLSSPICRQNLSLLPLHNLIFEMQMDIANTKAFSALLTLLHETPNLTIALNHAGWPPLDVEKSQWQQNLNTLGQFSNVMVKCSGWEMTRRDYQHEWQLKVISECIKAFTTKRVMLASNYPLCELSLPYGAFWAQLDHVVMALTPQLDEEQKKALFYKNAFHFYGFNSVRP